MVKVRGYCCRLLWILLLSPLGGWAQYALHIVAVDKDSSFVRKKLGLTAAFKSREVCTEYIYGLLPLLQGKGYVAASVDSVTYGEKGASLRLYVGEAWHWARIDTRRADPSLLAAVSWNDRTFNRHPMDLHQFQTRQQMMLDY